MSNSKGGENKVEETAGNGSGDSTQQKLGELALYIASRMDQDPNFGSVKLNKVLFYCDFLWYRNHGEPLTGVAYQKLDRGPAPRGIMPVIRELEAHGHAEVMVRTGPVPKVQKRLIPKRDADLSAFSGLQIAHVDSIIDWIREPTAFAISEYSHQHLGWRLAEYGEEIPYFTAHLADEGALPSDVSRGVELAKDFGWHQGQETVI